MPGSEASGFDGSNFRVGSPEVMPETRIEPSPGRALTDAEATYVTGTLGPAIEPDDGELVADTKYAAIAERVTGVDELELMMRRAFGGGNTSVTHRRPEFKNGHRHIRSRKF